MFVFSIFTFLRLEVYSFQNYFSKYRQTFESRYTKDNGTEQRLKGIIAVVKLLCIL